MTSTSSRRLSSPRTGPLWTWVAGLKAKPQVSALAAVSAANATAAAGDTPTKAEFDTLVTLANANKAAINAVIEALKA